MPKILQTGIPKLDEMLSGGVGEGGAILLLGTPGIDATMFACHMLIHNLRKGAKGLYFVGNKLPQSVQESIGRTTWGAGVCQKLVFIDGFSGSVGMKSGARYVVKNPRDIAYVSDTFIGAMRDMDSNTFAVFDSLSDLFGGAREAEIVELAKKWLDDARSAEITSVYLFTNWNFDEGTIKSLTDIFDYVIDLQSVEERILLRNYFSVSKSPGGAGKTAVPFRVGADGIAVYIPKILVTGPYHAGKSTFIHAVSTKAVSVDRLGTTIALDHGYIDYGELVADLFGTPGQERFSFMLDVLNKDTFGVIVLVDSTETDSFQRAKEIIQHTTGYGIPYVLSANKQDLPGALSIEEIRKQLELDESVPIIKTVAQQNKGCIECISALTNLIIAKGKKQTQAGR
ncbi:MAG: GTP-binding protein [Candidatus Micrarchaeota archaeon]